MYKINLDEIRKQIPMHPATNECPDQECMICGSRDCPHGEPLHYHHDGCPACYINSTEDNAVALNIK